MENVLLLAGHMNIADIFIRDYVEKLSHFKHWKSEKKITSSGSAIFYIF